MENFFMVVSDDNRILTDEFELVDNEIWAYGEYKFPSKEIALNCINDAFDNKEFKRVLKDDHIKQIKFRIIEYKYVTGDVTEITKKV